MEEFLQRTKSKLDRAKQLEKIHVVIGNKCCDLDSIISTLTYAYYLDKTSSPSILCLPVLNSSRVEFSFYSETRFILEELDIPESFLIFKDEISLQHLNDEGKLLLTLININTLISEDASLEASIVKVINPDNRLDGVQAFHESSSSLVAKKILEEAPELITRQLAHLLRGSILFSCLSVEHEIIPTQLEDILYMLEEKFPELPPRQDIISCLQETKLHTQGSVLKMQHRHWISPQHDVTRSELIGQTEISLLNVPPPLLLKKMAGTTGKSQNEDDDEENGDSSFCTNVDEIILNDYKELSDGDIKVAISTIYMMLEDLMSCRNIIGDLKLFVDKCGFDVLILLASSTPEEQPKMQQIAVYSESPELCNQVCCELEECQSPFLDMEPSDYGCERFYVYQQQNSFITSDQVAAIIKEAINRRRIGIHPNSRTSSTEAVAGSAPLSQGSSGIMELYGSDLDPQPNPVNFADNPQEVNGSVLPQVDINVDLVSPDSGLATIRSSRSSKESSVFLSDDSPVAEVAGPHQSFLAGADSYSPIPEGIIAEEATPPSRNNSDNLDIYNFDLAPNLRSESSSHSADYSMADDFFFHSDSSEGQQPVALKGQDEQNLYPGNIADCSTVLLNDNVENISLVEFDDDFMQSPESHEDFCEKNPPLSDIVEYDSPLSSEILGNLDVKIPPTPMNSLVESSPLDNGPPTFFPEDVIDKINEIGTNDSSQSQSKYVYWWNAGESNSAYETLMDADTWSSGEQELLFHSPVSCKDQKAKPSVKDNFGITLDCNRENTRENQGVKECKENTFSDLWKSSQSLPMMSDPWNVSAEVLLRDAKETANTWYTTEENNEPCFAKGSAIDEIHTDCSSENTPDNAIGNRISQELFERNQFLFKPHNDEKQGAVPKSKVLNPEINTTGDLGQPQNIYAWDLYDDSEPSRIVNLPMKWEDPFFSYSCMDFAVANTVKDAFVSSPDTNYSTSDSNISPTFGEEMKELEIPLEQKKIFDHTEKRKSENQTFNDAFHSHGENVIYPIKDTIKPPSETVQPGNEKSNSVNILVQNCMTHSEGTENINFAQSCILKLENRQDNNQMNNQRVSFRDESIFKCGEHQDISLNGKGLVGEAGPNNLPLGKNVHSILATPQHGEHTEISGITTNLCPFSKIGSDASCINKEQSDIANNTSVLHGSSVAAILPVDTECLPSQFPDKMVNTLSIKKEENVYELHSRKTLENEEVLHITSVVTENHDSPEPDLEEDTESSSLNTPDEIESPDSACLGKWNLLSKPLQDVIETQGTIGVQKTHTIDDNSQDEIRESKASNPDNRYSPSNQFSINPEANNSNKIHASNIYLESEDQFLNRQIKMEENVLFSNTSSVNYLQPMCFGVSDFVSQNGTCEDVWANTVSGNFDSADTDSDLSSGVSNKYLKEDLKHDTSNDKNTLSCSSHSSASSPEFDDSWGVLQENAHDTYLCTNKEKMPLSKNNDECFDMTATGVSKLTKEPITCNVLNKVPMNLDIWNTPVCEDSESSSTSPEENCSLYHSSMLERTAKHYSEDRQRKIENTDSVLFSEHQSNTTTADANYSLEICQTQLDCFYNYCSNDEFNVKTNKQTNQGLSLDTSLEKSILSEGCLADTNFTSVNKLQLGNCALESHNDDDKNTRKSKEALPPCEYAAKNGFSNNTLKHSTEILDWWKTDQQTGRNLEEESSQNNKQYRNNWMDKPNESINIVSLISLPRDHQSPTYFFEDSSSKFENPISSYAKNTQSMQYSPPNRNHGFNVDQLFLGDFNGVQKGPACVPLQIGTPNSCNSIAVPNICNNIFQTSRSPDCCTEYEVDQAYENEFETRIHSTHRTEVEVDKTLLQNVYLQKENNTSHLGNQLNEKITEAEVKNISETSNSHTSSAYKSFNDKLQNMCLTVPAELCQQSSILEVSGQIKKMLEPGLPLKQVDTTPELRDDAVWSSHISPEGGDIGSHKEFVEGLNPGLSNSRTVETSPVDEVTYGGFQSSSPDVIVHSFPLMDTNVTESGKAHSVNLPDTFHAISMTNTSEKQASPKSEYHSLGLEEKPSSIIPQRLASEKKSEDISEQEHSWSIILSQTEVSDSSPEDIFSRSVDSDKELSHSVHQGYAKSDKYQSESKDHEYTDLEESFEMCKIDSKPPVELHSSEADMRYMKHPEDGEAVKQLITGGAQREVLLDDVGMDIPFDAAEFRPEPPNSLDLNGSHTRKIKLTAPNINLSLDHSEGSILSDDNLDTPDELDINVDDLDTPDEADSFDYTGQDDRPALGEAAPENFESIQEYTAEEERSDNRLWRTVVIGEQEQRIDMKAIEPYKKVISHGGYYGEGVNAIIVFSACFLPDSSCSDYNYVMENLFLYVISTLELMVAEDYMIVYLNGATPRRKMPGLGWMKKCYQMIDRRLRKNLKSFIIVHPSWFIRTILAVTRPFISSKFSSKIKYVSTLAELRELIPMDYVQIPESIIKLDEELKEDESNKAGCLPGEPEITSLDHRTEKKNGDSL